MSALRDTIVGWVDQRMADMLAAPRMWGSDEAVEMQVLLLLELRALALRPALMLEHPGRIVDTYTAYVTERYAERRPLFQIVKPDELGMALAAELRAFLDAFLPGMLEENPFQHSDLCLRLRFEAGKAPAVPALMRYYEELGRATRAVAWAREAAAGRPAKGFMAAARAVDFTLHEVRVTPPNGAPAEALLLLGAGGAEGDPQPRAKLHAALAGLVSMGEWASSSAKVSDLPEDDPEQQARLAVQARRILPRRGIAAVGIGGKLVGRAVPVELRPEHERRLVEAIGSATKAEPFDRQDEIRGIDLERGLVLLGKRERLPCYAHPEQMGSVALAGVEAHVRGSLYRPLSGRPFVLAEVLERVEEADAEEE